LDCFLYADRRPNESGGRSGVDSRILGRGVRLIAA